MLFSYHVQEYVVANLRCRQHIWYLQLKSMVGIGQLLQTKVMEMFIISVLFPTMWPMLSVKIAAMAAPFALSATSRED